MWHGDGVYIAAAVKGMELSSRQAVISLQDPRIAAFPDEEEDGRDDDELCIVCWESVREVVFYQCMHMVRSSPSHTTCILLRCCPVVSCLHGMGIRAEGMCS